MNEESEKDECFESQIKILRFHGLWPARNNQNKIEVPHYFFRALRYSILFTLWCWSFIHLMLKFALNINEDVTDDLVVCFTFSFSGFILVAITRKQNEIIKFVEELRDFTDFGEPKGLHELIRKQKKMTVFIYVYTAIGATLFGVFNCFLMLKCEKKNMVNANTCGFVVPIYIPYEIDKKVKVVIIFIELIIVVYQMLLPVFIGTYFFVSIMDHLSLRLRHITKAVSSLRRLKNYHQRRRILIYCVRCHKNVIRLETTMVECFGPANAVHLFLTAIIIGVLNYKIYYMCEVKDIFHLVGWILTMALQCNSGQSLINEGMELSTQIYLLPWHNFEKPLQDIIRMYLRRTQKPIRVPCGIFYSYSNELFVAILKSSFSYMAILNQFNKHTTSK